MKEGGIKRLALVLLMCLLMQPSYARMGYDIIASAGGPSFELHRTTENEDLILYGSVNGTGNFSRLSHIRNFAGVKADEQTSCTKKSDLNYSEQLRLIAREGPVVVTVDLQSYNITNQSQSGFLVKESGDINVDEKWPTYFANLKKISYFGPGIRTSERYENNGDVVASYIDSWKLTKASLYRASYNRTIIDANIMPTDVFLDISSNKTSSYILGVQSTGSLTHLDVTQRGSANDVVNNISEDYRGQQNLNLKVDMSSYILKQPTEDIDWLPCCLENLTNEKLYADQWSVTDYRLIDRYPCFFQC